MAALVIDDQQGAVVEAVDAVETNLKGEAGKADGAVGFGFCDGEGEPRSFILKPFRDEAGEAQSFQFQIALRHAVAGTGRHFVAQNGLYVAIDEGGQVGEVSQVIERAEAFRRPTPNRVKDGVEQLTALRSGKPGLCRSAIFERRGAR